MATCLIWALAHTVVYNVLNTNKLSFSKLAYIKKPIKRAFKKYIQTEIIEIYHYSKNCLKSRITKYTILKKS